MGHSLRHPRVRHLAAGDARRHYSQGRQGRQGRLRHLRHRAHHEAAHPSRRARAGGHRASSDHRSDHRSDHWSDRTNHRDHHEGLPSCRACHVRSIRLVRYHPRIHRLGADYATHHAGSDPFRRPRHGNSSDRPAAAAPDPGDHRHPNGLCPFPSVSHARCRVRQFLAAPLADDHLQDIRVSCISEPRYVSRHVSGHVRAECIISSQ